MKTFGKLKPGDIVYELIDNREQVRKNIEADEERENSTLMKVTSFEDFRDENSYKYFIINQLIVQEVNPYYIEHNYHFMKMNGDRPTGTGTSTSRELDPHAVDIVFKDTIHLGQTRIDKNAAIHSLGFKKDHYYFVSKKDARKHYNALVKDFIRDLQSTITGIRIQKEENNKLLK
jgi:hypothetical protein